jgi:hypothetical protein
MTSQIPGLTSDLVQSLKLDTVAHADYTEHVYDDGENLRETRWRPIQWLGSGGGSEAVWLEKEMTTGETRAVKRIASTSRSKREMICSRELMAMAKFRRVSARVLLENERDAMAKLRHSTVATLSSSWAGGRTRNAFRLLWNTSHSAISKVTSALTAIRSLCQRMRLA